MEFTHAVPECERIKSPISLSTSLDHYLQSEFLEQDMHREWRVLSRCVDNQPAGRHSPGVTGCEIVSCLLQRQPLLFRFFLRLGVIQPSRYNRAGESLYAQSARHGNREMMHDILRKVKPKHLLRPIWLDEKYPGPSYIQVATGLPETFQVVLDEWLLKWPLEVSSLLTEADLYSITQFATPEIASSLRGRGVYIDRAKGPEGQSVWHAVVEYHEQPEKMLQWLLDHSLLSCDTTSCNGNTPLMLAIQLGRLEAAMWLSRWSDLGVPNCLNLLTAPELAAKCQTDESADILRVIMDSITLKEQRGRDLTIKAIHAVHNSRKDRTLRLRMINARHKKCETGREQEQSHHYQERLRVAEEHAWKKMRIICIAIDRPISSGHFEELLGL